MGRAGRDVRRRAKGFSLPELLVVVAILALAAIVAVPLISTRLREAQIRSAPGQFALALKAARMIAVARGRPVPVTVEVDPANRYVYQDVGGQQRVVDLPEGIQIVFTSTSPIVFEPNGAVRSDAETRFESASTVGSIERWTVRTNVAGVPRIEHVLVQAVEQLP